MMRAVASIMPTVARSVNLSGAMTIPTDPLAALDARHRREEHDLLRDGLSAHGWRLRTLAVAWGRAESSLRRALERHPDLAARYARTARVGCPTAAARAADTR
jgi:hypothetical protein